MVPRLLGRGFHQPKQRRDGAHPGAGVGLRTPGPALKPERGVEKFVSHCCFGCPCLVGPPPPVPTPSPSATPPRLELFVSSPAWRRPTRPRLAAETGAGDVVLGYLRARGLARTATLALVEPDETRFKATVVDPLIAGFRDEATNTEFRVARAILLHMFLEARSQWDAWSASRAAALSPNAGPPAGASTAPAPAMLNLPSPPAGPPPKSFEAWGPLVQAYNAKLLDDKPRQFPTRRLAGADAILARIYHEHTVSKAYTPLLLGASRPFAWRGSSQALATRRTSTHTSPGGTGKPAPGM